MLAHLENGRISRITHNPAAGEMIRPCWRGLHLNLVQEAPDRILKPLIRNGPRGSGQFREADWGEALDLIAERLIDIRSRHGAESVMNMSSAGSTGALHDTGTLTSRFLALFGGCTQQIRSYSNGAASYILPYLLGEDWKRAGFDAATMRHAKMIVLWGANVLEARLGSEIPQRLMEARQRGAEVVVIDPRRSLTAKKSASWWVPIRPGTDAALMLALLYVMVSEGRVDKAFVRTHCVGFDELERYVTGADGVSAHTPEWASGVTGVPADDITRLARMYSDNQPTMLLPGYSIQRVFAGEETYRLGVALQVASGNFGRLGGSCGGLNNRLPTPRVGELSISESPNMPGIPVLRWPDAVLEGRSGGYPSDIHAIYSAGGNYLNQGSDIRKNIRAFIKSEFNVCHELFLTPTAQYCDVVFPAAGPLEKEDIGIPWLGNYLLYKPQVLPRRGSVRSDYEIFCGLAERLGFLEKFSENRSESDWINQFILDSEIPDLDNFRQSGVYLAPDQERTGLDAFAADPQANPLTTESGLVEIASERFHRETGQTAIPTWQPQPEDARYPLLLMTPKDYHRTHSQGSNIAYIREKAAHALDIHPKDASERGVVDGVVARLYNDRGEIRVRVRYLNDILPGVVCLPEGVWAELDDAGVEQEGSANMLTDTSGTLAGTACVMHAVPVQVSSMEYERE
jgi:molybdopterin guanine dinucleotide-containing S/N-oxide reductase-like protein